MQVAPLGNVATKNIRVLTDQSLERVLIHTGAYVSAYGTQGRGSNMKNPQKEENKFLNVVNSHTLYTLYSALNVAVIQRCV